MKATPRVVLEATVAARIAGEDLVCGDFVAVLNEIIELPSFFWNCSAVSLPPDETVRIRCMSGDAGQPYKVIGICLPFVYVQSCERAIVVMDTRKRQLVRLDRDCARAVWKYMKSPPGKASK